MLIKIFFRKTWERSIDLLNKLLPKKKQVLLIGNHQIEDNIIELANYLAANTNYKVICEISESYFDKASSFLDRRVKLENSEKKIKCLFLALRSSHIIYTYPYSLAFYTKSKRQKFINLWHGVGHKKIGKLAGRAGVPADISVATSEMIRTKFSKTFGVPENSFITAGYPRNDRMLISQENKDAHKKKLNSVFQEYDKILIWMPTYRRIYSGNKSELPTGNSIDLDHVFQVENFNVKKFNLLLRKHNALCFVKPHQLYQLKENSLLLSNIRVIDNNWIYRFNISLYQFLGLTDALITDFSSVMTDYTLLEQPIFCFATDLEDYKKSGNLYFEDYENYIPTKFIENQNEFFKNIEEFLISGLDKNEIQRKRVKDLYFKFKDTKNSERIANKIFN